MRQLAFALAAIVVFGGLTSAPAQDRIAIRAARVVTGTGTDHENGVILIRDGRVERVGSNVRIPDGYRVVDRSKSTVAPGLIDIDSVAGATGQLTESAVAIDRQSRAVEALEMDHRDWSLLASSGVTSVVVLPGRGNPITGTGCVVKTTGRVGEADAVLAMTIGQDATSTTRFPTSVISARRMLEEAVTDGRKGEGKDGVSRFSRGEIPGIAWVRTESDILSAAALAKDHGVRVGLLGAGSVREIVPRLKGTGLAVAIPPLSLSSSRLALGLPVAMANAGLSVAFSGRLPTASPDVLRISAALAHRHGLSREAAIASVTSVPARMAGVEKRIGTIAPGLDADFQILSGDPLSLASRLEETWIDGRRVWRRPVHHEEAR